MYRIIPNAVIIGPLAHHLLDTHRALPSVDDAINHYDKRINEMRMQLTTILQGKFKGREDNQVTNSEVLLKKYSV